MVDDTFLALVFDEGACVITGYGHAGIENVVGHAKSITGKPLHGLMGSLHLYGADDGRIDEKVAALEHETLKLLAGLYCTGPFVQGRLRRGSRRPTGSWGLAAWWSCRSEPLESNDVFIRSLAGACEL